MKFQITEHATLAATKGQVSSDLCGEVVILNLDSGMYYGLDTVGARIWNLAQIPRTVHDVRELVLAEYEVDTERCEHDLLALLESLLNAGLVEVRDETAA